MSTGGRVGRAAGASAGGVPFVAGRGLRGRFAVLNVLTGLTLGLTAPLTAAGAIALTYLRECGITVRGEVRDETRLRARAAAARAEGDSVGGVIRCTVTGLPAGLGGSDWRDTVEGEIARHIFAIPGVKAIGFGAGEDFAALRLPLELEVTTDDQHRQDVLIDGCDQAVLGAEVVLHQTDGHPCRVGDLS